MHELPKGDIAFKLPIRIDDPSSYEPSPGRNFTNPQTLEAFEDEAIKGVMHIYGYDT